MIETIQEHLEALIFGTIRADIKLQEKKEIIEGLFIRSDIVIEDLEKLIEENVSNTKPITVFDEYIEKVVAKTLEENLCKD